MTPTLILPVAPPGAGKSALAAILVKWGLDPDGIVCPDEYRRIMTGDRANQTANGQVFLVCDTITEVRLSKGLNVYYDATNLTTLDRHKEIADHYGARIVCVRFSVGADELLRRNKTRPHPVPDDVLNAMISNFNFMPLNRYPGTVITLQEAHEWAERGEFG